MNLRELETAFNEHVNNVNNPHNITNKVILGLDNVDNTSDASKPLTPRLEAELSKKMNISDVYNSVEDSEEIDLHKVPWSAAQGYSMKNVIDAYEGQDTSALEARIKWCEDNV